VVAQHRGRYVVARDVGARDPGGAPGERGAVLAGRLRHAAAAAADLPAVGDWVAVAPAGDGDDVVAAVLPRRTAFVRRAAGEAAAAQVVAANVDVALVVDPLAGGAAPPNARRLARYAALAWESGALPVVVLTKADRCDDVPAALAAARAAAPGADAVALSPLTGAGVEALAPFLRPGRTAVLLGPSGAGKSTLANRLLGDARLRTSGVRADGKGRHTTTHRELVRLDGGALLVDTPGMRELGMWDAEAGVDDAFGDVLALAGACRFRDCAHGAEPGCAVRAAAAAGRLDPARVAHWHALRRELAFLERRHDRAAREAWDARARAGARALDDAQRRKYGP
jgi:ribosome biogenesis GTPase